MKRCKMLSISDGIKLECIKLIPQSGEKENNPFRLYLLYHGRDKYGFPAIHRNQIAKYGDFFSVICFIHDLYRSGVNGYQTSDILEWCSEYQKRK